MFDKYKSLVQDDMLFYGLLILLVGLSSFGLGRWSVVDEVPSPSQAAVRMTSVPEETAEREVTPKAAAGADAPAAGAGQYVGSKKSDKYHLPWCSGAKRIKEENKVWFASEADASAAGYVPAANCQGI